MMSDLLLHEHAYAEIVRVDGRITALWRLDPRRMRVEHTPQKVYRYTLENGQTQTWRFDASQPPLLDLEHPSPLRQCCELVATGLALQWYVGRFFGSGGRPMGVLKSPLMIGEEQVQRMRTQWDETHGTLANSHRPVILEGGLSYESLASDNGDAQLNELSQTLRTEIAAVFRVPVWRVGDWSKANFSNMEASERTYVGDALDPFFTCWEEAIRRDLLTVRQYNQFTVSFDRTSLIRSDSKTLSEALAVGRQNGWYSANDIRRKLGENPLPAEAGGDEYLINSALAPTIPKEPANA
jgi:HK97 family phage portal protein